MADVAHRFARGSRLRIEIASAAALRIDLNLNTGRPTATDTGGVAARQTVYHDRARPSRVILPVMASRQQ
jgi:hypothetical protein